MCSIAGLIVIGDALADPQLLAQEFHSVFTRGTIRGRDSYGVVVVDRDGGSKEWKETRVPPVSAIEDLFSGYTSVVIANTRATPTTEWAEKSTPQTIQPFRGAGWVVTHNGTVANDRELLAELDVTLDAQVDTAVLPYLFGKYNFEPGLGRIQGSFALAAVDYARPRTLFLAKSFKPLALMRHPSLPVIFFASVEEQLTPALGESHVDLTLPRVENFAPYSLVTIDGHSGACSLRPLSAPPARRRALVIASGGLDSTVAATLLEREGYEVVLLHFTYGCHAETAELRSVRAVADALWCDHRIVPLRWLGDLGASALTTSGSWIAPCEVGAEYPHEWVPARNMLMIAYACAIADAEGFTHIALGTNLEEGGSYPDNTQEFIKNMDQASVLGTLSRARVIAPLGNMVKREIVRLGIEIGAPLDKTWSCYRNGDVHCGECGPCFMRRTAFRANGTQDPIQYATDYKMLRPVMTACPTS